MMVLVDTPVWSLALRRRPADLAPHEGRLTAILTQLVREGRAQLLGSTRQEVLSGIREQTTFRRIREALRAFEDVAVTTNDFEEAARISNDCRSSGIASTPVDMLLCAVSLAHDWQILSTDLDFLHYAKIVPIQMLPYI